MPVITLPDGSQKKYDKAVTAFEVAESIGQGLAKAAIAAKVNDQLVDLSHVIAKDSALQIITEKSDEAQDIIRHSTAHLLAHAVKNLYPGVEITIGPVIENGFYYDFDYDTAWTPADLEKIEKEMEKLAKEAIAIHRKELSKKDAFDLFKKQKQHYKIELIEELPKDETISIYEQGDFVDLCRGPHVPNTRFLKAFKLTKLAGAYWRGDSKNKMLQRIYGTAFTTPKALETYLHNLAEAEKRDHRKIGTALDLFHLEENSPGMVFWHAKGYTIYRTIVEYMRQTLIENDYQEILTPLILEKTLWEKSGHWDKFKDNMFITTSEEREFAIKPMNCPGHILVFNQGLKSYRDLPLRTAEFGMCHRNELSGALHGLMRIREFTQDDAHVFCTEEQLEDEILKLIKIVYKTYQDFGFNQIIVRLATRPEKRIGDDKDWDQAEKVLEKSLNDQKISFVLAPGEGAFYGPKIEFHLRDCLDRIWQCGTIQVDFSMPKRLGATYVAADSSRKTPIMIHRAIFGSLERFIGILIEQHAGFFPVWLSPIQVAVMNITDKQSDYVQKVAKELKKHGVRVIFDLRNEKISFKIREHALARIPYLLIVGDREVENNEVAVRTRTGEDLKTMSLEGFLKRLKDDIMERRG